MLNNLTENAKFFIMIIIYTGTMAWWAATLNSTVVQQAEVAGKTIVLLDRHIEECNKRKIADAKLIKDVEYIRNDLNDFKIRQHQHYDVMEPRNGIKKR